MKRRRDRKQAQGTRTPTRQVVRPNARWSLDFLADSFGALREFRIPAEIDDCCRENLYLVERRKSFGSPRCTRVGRVREDLQKA